MFTHRFAPYQYTGWGSAAQLLSEVERHAPKRILCVTSKSVFRNGTVERVLQPLREAGYDIDIYTDTMPEPPLAAGEALVRYTREGKFDLVIGLGGGSALDLAKLAAVLSQHEGAVADYLNLSGTRQLSVRGLPKILIPTTSGTGSEITDISVLSLETTKDVVAHDYLLADAAIIDPELTVSVPPRVTAASGMDALTHAIEAYVSVHASPTTDGVALHAIRLISRSLVRAVKDGTNKEARTEMSYGSYLAGLAFFNAGVGGVHALAYPLGGQFHLSHGESNAVLLPYVMNYIRGACMTRLRHIAEAMGADVRELSDAEASCLAIERMKQLIEETGIPQTLDAFEIPRDALESLVQDGIQQRRLLARSPLLLTEDDIRRVYLSAFEGVLAEAAPLQQNHDS
ncbi:iron-containing alcohol dehydrogenase [Paenibacillus alvei]|uniref:Long-chain-alcohol dehydrogenase 1 n=1 Tax=Paenibacillus alvei TaxID=44250 RepID=A0A383RLP4_PAEAL|nr:iron-containing alcohol dehydrogenase [Paenibacillus alvei]SYX87309.1 Long-chain-alcohol dehydrogenase 1 [Paenibacillus alvei]